MIKNTVFQGKYSGCNIVKGDDCLVIQVDDVESVELTPDIVESAKALFVGNINAGSDYTDKLLSVGTWGALGGLAFGAVGAIAGAIFGNSIEEPQQEYIFDENVCFLSVKFKDGTESILIIDEDFTDRFEDGGVDVDVKEWQEEYKNNITKYLG